MTLTLTLSPDLEERLRKAAAAKGLPAVECAVQVLDRGLPPDERSARLQALFEVWEKEDAQGAENDDDVDVFKLLDEDRLSDRPLYPPEMKGKTR